MDASSLQQAIAIVQSHGLSVCRHATVAAELSSPIFHNNDDGDGDEMIFSSCNDLLYHDTSYYDFNRRYLQKQQEFIGNEEQVLRRKLLNGLAALFCVFLAALAAGLTLGLLGLDPLVLLIKERAGVTRSERQMAKRLLPIVNQHHRLLVTLLLMNSIANEALPIFLEAVVSPTVAVLLSVTLVLFFGEIIPSAIFTGPNQLETMPIAKLLDWVLNDDEELGAYNRGELSALIRIQYEQRLAVKRKRKEERKALEKALDKRETRMVGALDFWRGDNNFSTEDHPHNRTSHSLMSYDSSRALKAMKNRIDHNDQLSRHSFAISECSWEGESIMLDEVMMVEGALQMKKKLAMDLMCPRRATFILPHDMILNERNMVKIYASGFSRIPVYRNDINRHAIIGVLLTKQLIVVHPDDDRPLHTLPLYCPTIVGPSTTLVDLLNILQMGGGGMKGGHLALVCANTKEAEIALSRELPVPESAGWMGIVTLEDVLEALLQEEIYDEQDAPKKLAAQIWSLWTQYKKRKKRREGSIEKAASSGSGLGFSCSERSATLPSVSETEGIAPWTPKERNVWVGGEGAVASNLEEGLATAPATETTALLSSSSPSNNAAGEKKK